jgi:hypothetical protein
LIEVVATTEDEAKQKAAREWRDTSTSLYDAEPLRPYVEQPGGGTYELFDRRTGETIPDTEFSARNQSDVNTRVDDYINHGQHGLNSVDARLAFGARPVVSGPNLNGRPSNPDGNYVIIDQANPTRPVYRYMASDSNDGLLVLQQWISANRGATQWTFKHDPDQSLGQPGSSADADQGDSTNPLRPTGPGPWEVYNRQTGNSTVNLIQDGQPITDRAQAQRQAMALISTGRHDLYGVRTIGTDTISPQSVAQRPSEIERDWRIVDRETDETLNTVRGASQDQALAVRDDTARRHGVDPRQLSLQVIFNPVAAQQEIPEVPLDIEQNFPQASSAPAGNSFSGQWKVMIDGEEVWRFRGVGNNQADANRIAQTWILDQIRQRSLSPVEGADVEVLPVMI